MHEYSDQPEESSLLEEKTSEFKNYINQGIDLIKEGGYSEAINHFKREEALSKIGKSINPARDKTTRKLPEPDEYGNLADFVARNSWTKSRSIELSNIIYLDYEEDGKLHVQKLPTGLEREICLIYLEEWLHCLQHLQGKPLTEQEDKELDVALYMERNGIPLTEAFKSRYNRRSVLKS